MKTKKQTILILLVTLVMTLVMTTFTAMADEKGRTIGVLLPLEHQALNAAYEGFRQALNDKGLDDITYDLQNAQGDTSNLSTIADRFVSKNYDMILAIGTDSAQTVAAKTETIPILATAVTSYMAAGLIETEEAPGVNITGTSDMNPVKAQIALLKELIPQVETIGLVYNSSEENSVLQINLAKEEIEAMGLRYAEATVTNTSEVQQAVQSLVRKADALYIPTDNTLASAMPTVYGVTSQKGIATVCGESNMVMEGGFATLGINYYDLGYQTGLMAYEVLCNGADPAQMPIQYADNSDVVTINAQVAEELGIAIPEKYQENMVSRLAPGETP